MYSCTLFKLCSATSSALGSVVHNIPLEHIIKNHINYEHEQDRGELIVCL